jgi:hypothetical protein
MLGLGDPPRFFGSGFFVGDVDVTRPVIERDQVSDVFLVTARHVVAEPLFRGVSLCARIPRYRDSPVDVPLPANGWIHAESGADVSVLRLPNLRHELRIGGNAFTVITRQQFFVDGWHRADLQFEVADRVRLFGLWYGETRVPQVIIREGTMALATIDPVQFDSGATRAYLIDATVTRAMSGGPAYITRGEGTAQNALIGVIHGYWPLPDAEFQGPVGEEGETGDERAQRAIRGQLERLNSHLAIVVPVHEIAQALLQAGWAP